MRCEHPYYDKVSGARFPCGQCPACVKDRRRAWTLRLRHESERYIGSAVFLTLTYRDADLKSNSLIKDDYQRFLKRLRKRFSARTIRYFVSGEYGAQRLRPHFHFILFGIAPSELALYKFSVHRKNNYTASAIIDKLWPNGYNVVGSVTKDSISYVAGYVTKKLYHTKFYERFALLPPFCHCSHGIGKEWALAHADELKSRLYCSSDGYKVSIPRYYRKLLDITADAYEDIIKVYNQNEYNKYDNDHNDNHRATNADYPTISQLFRTRKAEYCFDELNLTYLSKKYLDKYKQSCYNYNMNTSVMNSREKLLL